jgi:hypothetical protein
VILHSQKQDPQRYADSIFTIAAYKKTSEQPIIPLDLTNVNGDEMHSPPTAVSDEEDPESVEDDSVNDDSVLPPSTRRPPGRPPIQSAESVVGRMKLIAQSANSNVGGADRMDTRALRAVKGLIMNRMRQHDCFQCI